MYFRPCSFLASLVGFDLAALGIGKLTGDLLPACLERQIGPTRSAQDPDGSRAQHLREQQFDVDQSIHAVSLERRRVARARFTSRAGSERGFS